jgi:gas vesicle protein
MLTAALRDERVRIMSYKDFKKFLASQNFLPLTKAEQYALRSVKLQVFNDIKGLGNRISKDLTQTLIEVDKRQRSKMEKLIKYEAEQAIVERRSVKELSGRLKEKTQDWARDFDKISDYVMHQAYDEGRAFEIQQNTGNDSLVYKEVFPEACTHCQEAYLTNGVGSKPIVFKVVDLLNNGTNIGRKVKEWRPVIGAMHPFCRCSLMKVPKGMKWNEETKSFDKPILKRKVPLKGKIKITVNNKEI